jgi:hypothetical protein
MFFPTAAIFEPRISTEPFSIVPFVTVSTVALRISVTRSCARRGNVMSVSRSAFFISICSR